MQVSETKKHNKYAALITYVIAVVCLLAGLFVPLFNGTGILAMNIPDVINHLVGSEVIQVTDRIELSYVINLFGTGTMIDVMAYALLLYVFVTLLALLAFIPIIIAFVKDKGEIISVFAYIIEIAAVIVLSVYLFMAMQLLPDTALSYNMVIALGGTLIPLIVLSFINKGKPAALKLLLFALSAIGVLTLFDYAAIIPGLSGEDGTVKFYASYLSYEGFNSNGISFLSALFGYGGGMSFGEILAQLTEAKFKAAFILGAVAGLAVIVNYLIDVISLTSNAKRVGLLFNIVRYGVELAAAICLIITVFACSYSLGLFLILLAVTALIRTGVSVLRFILDIKHAKEEQEKQDESEQTIRFAKPAKAPKVAENAESEKAIDVTEQPAFVGAEPIEIQENPVTAEKAEENSGEQMAFIEPAPVPAKEEAPEEVKVIEHPGEVQMQMPEEQLPPVEEEEEEIPTVHAIEEQLNEMHAIEKQLDEMHAAGEPDGYEDEEDDEIPTVRSVTESTEDDEDEEPLQPLIPLQPLEPLQPVAADGQPIIPVLQPLEPLQPLQPVEPVKEQPAQLPEPAKEQPARLHEPEPVKEQPVQPPVQPVYERPVQPAQPVYEQPAQPVYERPAQPPVQPVYERPVQPVQPVYERPAQPPVQPVYERPVQPAQPVYEQPVQPAQPVYEQPVQPVYERPAQPPVQPVYERPVQPAQPVYEQPVQPVYTQPAQPPVYAQPAQPARKPAEQPFTIVDDGKNVYTVRYGGPSDEFLNKLTNEEKMEFALTFIEKGRGDIGNIPEYVIGGNNKKFFSAVFIYLGRIRGMISDGLLNKMFKEQNMM